MTLRFLHLSGEFIKTQYFFAITDECATVGYDLVQWGKDSNLGPVGLFTNYSPYCQLRELTLDEALKVFGEDALWKRFALTRMFSLMSETDAHDCNSHLILSYFHYKPSKR